MAEQPTELELRILKVLWEQAPRKVREIRQALAESGHAIAHTTVITVLNIMAEKGFVTRSAEKNAFLFAPRVGREEISGRYVGDLVDRIFDGAAAAVILNVLRQSEIDPNELHDLRQVINRLVKEQQEEGQ